MMGDRSLPKRCPTTYQRLVMISGEYHVEYWAQGKRFSFILVVLCMCFKRNISKNSTPLPQKATKRTQMQEIFQIVPVCSLRYLLKMFRRIPSLQVCNKFSMKPCIVDSRPIKITSF